MKKIQILGTGCPKCKLLFANAEAAVKSAGIEAQLEKIEKAAKRAAKKTEKKAAKAMNGAKPVLQPQATFHPHPPVGGAAQ